MVIDHQELCMYGAAGVLLLPSVIYLARDFYRKVTADIDNAEAFADSVARESSSVDLSGKL